MTCRRRDLRAFAAGVLASLPGAILLLWATRHGAFLGGDSATYLDMARNLSLGHGPRVSDFGATEPAATVHFPPLYPLFLAIVGDGVRFWHAALLCLTGGLTAILAGRSLAVAALVAAWVTLTPDALLTYGGVMSEALFVPLSLAAVWAATRRWVAVAAAFGVAAALTRHAGIFVILPILAVGLTPVLSGTKGRIPTDGAESGPSLRSGPAWGRLRSPHVGSAFTASLAAAAVVASYLLWRILTPAVPDRLVAWHPPGEADRLETLRAFGGWVWPAGDVGGPVRAGLLVVALFAVAAVVGRRQVGIACVTAVVGYAGVVITARSLLDASIPLGGRIWLPVMPFVAVALVGAVRHKPRRHATPACATSAGEVPPARRVAGRRRAGQVPRLLLLTALLGVVTANLSATLPLAGRLHRDGLGYTAPAWRSSPTLAYVASLPRDTPVVSDAADAAGLLLRRPATFVPPTRFRTGDRPNRWWRAQLREQAKTVRDAGGVYVFFDAVDRDDFRVTPEDLAEVLDVEEVARFPDGVAFRVVGFP